LREPRRKLNSKANSGEVRAKYVCRRQAR